MRLNELRNGGLKIPLFYEKELAEITVLMNSASNETVNLLNIKMSLKITLFLFSIGLFFWIAEENNNRKIPD